MIEPGGGYPVARRNDGLAIASLATGIASLVCCGLVTGVPAIIMGLVSRSRIARTPEILTGAGMAIAGVILGIAGSLIWTAVVIVGGIVVYNVNAGHTATASSIPCDQLEHTLYHYHVALQIIDKGNPVAIPTDIGRPGFCFYWIHMHADSPGVIHIESPQLRTFTVGDFFDVWAKTSNQPVRLDSSHVGTISLSSGQTVVAFVDGQRYEGDPRSIALVSHGVIQLEITPPTIDPPPVYTFPPGF
ncbi:MAG: DUF4190 domain-containing protein [Chloroflexi bacterium]|nr:MAG: DUF4190 domain-containing protein [Chloroflexota bacterium]